MVWYLPLLTTQLSTTTKFKPSAYCFVGSVNEKKSHEFALYLIIWIVRLRNASFGWVHLTLALSICRARVFLLSFCHKRTYMATVTTHTVRLFISISDAVEWLDVTSDILQHRPPQRLGKSPFSLVGAPTIMLYILLKLFIPRLILYCISF